jgi:hypothetical protein
VTTKHYLNKLFEEKKEFHVRSKKTWWKDYIYRAMSKDALLRAGLSKGDLKNAVTSGWLEKQSIEEKGKYRTVYINLGREMPQREPFKIWIDKIYRYFKNELDEYY